MMCVGWGRVGGVLLLRRAQLLMLDLGIHNNGGGGGLLVNQMCLRSESAPRSHQAHR